MAQTIPFTPEAYAKLQNDLESLTKERAEVMVRLQTAREMGDLSENGAYIYAKQELGRINRLLAQTRHLLQQGHVVQKNPHSQTVEFGTTVTLKQGSKEITYTLVSIHESNIAEHKLSTESPLGSSIFKKRVGEKVSVNTPSGTTEYTIIKIA